MYSVRQLISSAFRKSTVRGLGDTPDDEEVKEALDSLNDILDNLTSQEEFSASKKVVEVETNDVGFATIGYNPQRIVTTAIADGTKINVTTLSNHGLHNIENITLRIGGKDYSTFVTSVNSITEFEAAPVVGLMGTYAGSFKKASEGPEYSLDIIDIPPVSVFQVVGMDGKRFTELQEQYFYRRTEHLDGNWYFYEKANSPYPKVWTSKPHQKVRVIYDEPFWHNLTLDSDIENMPKIAKQIIKYSLAAMLADENGYVDVGARLQKIADNNKLVFFRNNANTATPEADHSAPGYSGRHYDIWTDEYRC